MELVTLLLDLIPTVGFPIVCVVAMAIFIVKIFKHISAQNHEVLQSMQEKCAQREEKLLAEIKENREINANAIETISKYAERLEAIQIDVSEIKIDIVRLSERLKN